MKILATYEDGSRTVLYEPGDRVRLKRVSQCDSWIAETGELGTVIRRERPRVEGKPSSIDFLQVQTDSMKAGGWGVITIPPWDVESIDDEVSL